MSLLEKISAALGFSEPRKLSMQETQKHVKDCLDAYLAMSQMPQENAHTLRDFYTWARAEKEIEKLWHALYLGGLAPKPSQRLEPAITASAGPIAMFYQRPNETTKKMIDLGLVIVGDFGGYFGIQRNFDGNSSPVHALYGLRDLGVLTESEVESYRSKFLKRSKVMRPLSA